ncbi:MAG: BMP family ABC transporter substrate-binding protein [Ilumatobacteraceae bacterium]
MRNKHVKEFALAVAIALGLAACGSSDNTSTTDAPIDTAAPDTVPAAVDLKVAVVYIGVPGDAGWTYQHDQGIAELEAALGITVTRLENIPEGAEATATYDKLARDGYNLIFGTSFGYMDPMFETAAKYPDVCFEHNSGYKTSTNMGTYFGANSDASYLSGIAAGAASPSGKIGYVAAFPIPEVVRNINAYTLGARSVNPDATVQVTWTSTWFDPAKEKEAAQSLLDAGVDVLGMYQDSTATGEAAKEAGAKWTGNDSDTKAGDFPDTWLTAPVWEWGPYYIKTAESLIAGTCPVDQFYGNMADGTVRLGVFGSSVSAETQATIAAAQATIVEGSFSVFTGPIKDNKGTVQIAAGAVAPLGDLLGMQYLVEGVIGEIPAG